MRPGRALHRRAAGYFLQIDQPEETVYHLLEAREYVQAAVLLEEIGPGLVQLGRFDSLGAWIRRLPEEILRAAGLAPAAGRCATPAGRV